MDFLTGFIFHAETGFFDDIIEANFRASISFTECFTLIELIEVALSLTPKGKSSILLNTKIEFSARRSD